MHLPGECHNSRQNAEGQSPVWDNVVYDKSKIHHFCFKTEFFNYLQEKLCTIYDSEQYRCITI